MDFLPHSSSVLVFRYVPSIAKRILLVSLEWLWRIGVFSLRWCKQNKTDNTRQTTTNKQTDKNKQHTKKDREGAGAAAGLNRSAKCRPAQSHVRRSTQRRPTALNTSNQRERKRRRENTHTHTHTDDKTNTHKTTKPQNNAPDALCGLVGAALSAQGLPRHGSLCANGAILADSGRS